MIIDCHMHYDEGMFPLERMLACMETHGIAKVALIPTMVEPFSLGGKAAKSGTDLLRFNLVHLPPMGRFFYDALTLDKKGNFVLLGKKYRIYEKPDNASVAAAIDKHPDKFMGWIFINPAVDDDPVSEIERWSSHPGMVGVKAHPFWHDYPVERLDAAAAWCREHGYPLLIHFGSRRGSGDYRRLPEKYPGLKLLYAHAGVPYYKEMWSYIKDKKDVYIDLSSPYLNQGLVKSAVDFLGADRCLYGTDGPYGEQPVGEDYDYGWIKGWIESLSAKDEELEKIFGVNFESIRKS
jgi:predicted TIM-barrel fold metal-dependent hydrolase